MYAYFYNIGPKYVYRFILTFFFLLEINIVMNGNKKKNTLYKRKKKEKKNISFFVLYNKYDYYYLSLHT